MNPGPGYTLLRSQPGPPCEHAHPRGSSYLNHPARRPQNFWSLPDGLPRIFPMVFLMLQDDSDFDLLQCPFAPRSLPLHPAVQARPASPHFRQLRPTVRPPNFLILKGDEPGTQNLVPSRSPRPASFPTPKPITNSGCPGRRCTSRGRKSSWMRRIRCCRARTSPCGCW